MNRSKIFILILIVCVFFNLKYLDSLSGWLVFTSQLMIFFGVLLLYNKIRDVFSPIVVTFVGMLIPFSIKGMYILETEKFPKEDLVTPLFYYIIFIFFFILALLIKNKKIVISSYKVLSNRCINYSSLIFTSFILVLIGVILFGFKMGTLSPSALVSDVLSNRISMQNSGGLYVQTLILLTLQTALFINVVALFKTRERKFLISAFFILVVNFLVTFTLGGRGMIIVPILMIFFYKYKITGKSDWIRIFLFTFIFIVFSGWYGMYRDGVTTSNDTLLISEVFGNILDRYVQFDNFIRVVKDPADYYFGKSFIDFLTSPIPRNIYPDKPYNFNSQMTQIYHPIQAERFLVTDFTMLSELLLNFGILGIAVGGFIFGRIISYFNYAYNYFNTTNNLFLFLYPFFMLKPMSYLYGGLINSTVNMMVLLEVPIILLLWIIYTNKQKTL